MIVTCLSAQQVQVLIIAFSFLDHRHHRQRVTPLFQPSVRLSVPLHPHPPPHTPSHPLASPLTASTVIANISSLVSLPSSTPLSPIDDGSTNTQVPPVERASTLMGPPFTQNVHSSIGEEILPDAGSGFLNHAPDRLVPPVGPQIAAESMETESVERVQASKSSSKKSKSRSKKRKKHKQSKTSIDNMASSEDLLNSSEGRHEDRGTLVDQLNPRAQHASTNGVISDGQLEGEARLQAPPQKEALRVKEEPVSDTEETCHRPSTTKVREK